MIEHGARRGDHAGARQALGALLAHERAAAAALAAGVASGVAS
jgi:hypothetical protein